MLFNLAVLLLALILDYKFSEVSRHHPLVYFGSFANQLELKLRNLARQAFAVRILGLVAWMLAVIPLTYLSYLLEELIAQSGFYQLFGSWLYAGLVLYIALGWRSLKTHAQAIITPLKSADIDSARRALSHIVSRDTEQLNSGQISNAATESVLENGADAIFAAIFWFVILGVPGVVLYRAANTLDAMWGYKNPRYLYFGWAAARLDDLLNYIPARLSALSYALLGNCQAALNCWKSQGVNWKSPNAGPVMAAGAGAINVRLGGGSNYHGKWQDRPVLGPENGSEASYVAIEAACFLVDRVLFLWVAVLWFAAWLS
ncbi:MAG: cobalamin biosynthesis protein CobD [Osedax symbiont Rs1]|nr:MAG: cobalamin biosynthesis protein CobD [Osedax symbiont Rs1]